MVLISVFFRVGWRWRGGVCPEMSAHLYTNIATILREAGGLKTHTCTRIYTQQQLVMLASVESVTGSTSLAPLLQSD